MSSDAALDLAVASRVGVDRDTHVSQFDAPTSPLISSMPSQGKAPTGSRLNRMNDEKESGHCEASATAGAVQQSHRACKEQETS